MYNLIYFCPSRSLLDSLFFDSHICWSPLVSTGNLPWSILLNWGAWCVEAGSYV